MLFHQDNAPVHTSVIATATINELKLKLLPHAPYSLDIFFQIVRVFLIRSGIYGTTLVERKFSRVVKQKLVIDSITRSHKAEVKVILGAVKKHHISTWVLT